MNRLTLYLTGFAILATTSIVEADDAHHYDAIIKNIVENEIKPLLADPLLAKAVIESNAQTENNDQKTIDALDAKWQTEAKTSEHPFIDEMLHNATAKRLRDIKRGAGNLFNEIILMDDHGRNVAVSDITSDYWQGDEAKWQKTYPVGGDAIFIDAIKHDDSTGKVQVQVSASIADPTSHAAIGAITFGVDLHTLDTPGATR